MDYSEPSTRQALMAWNLLYILTITFFEVLNRAILINTINANKGRKKMQNFGYVKLSWWLP